MGKKVFKCDLRTCEKLFASKFSLKRHYLIHLNQKKHVCKFCQKSFVLPQYLEEHEYTHTGAKPFQCGINGCPEQFRQRGKLSLHKKHAHNLKNLEQDGDNLLKCGGILPQRGRQHISLEFSSEFDSEFDEEDSDLEELKNDDLYDNPLMGGSYRPRNLRSPSPPSVLANSPVYPSFSSFIPPSSGMNALLSRNDQIQQEPFDVSPKNQMKQQHGQPQLRHQLSDIFQQKTGTLHHPIPKNQASYQRIAQINQQGFQNMSGDKNLILDNKQTSAFQKTNRILSGASEYEGMIQSRSLASRFQEQISQQNPKMHPSLQVIKPQDAESSVSGQKPSIAPISSKVPSQQELFKQEFQENESAFGKPYQKQPQMMNSQARQMGLSQQPWVRGGNPEQQVESQPTSLEKSGGSSQQPSQLGTGFSNPSPGDSKMGVGAHFISQPTSSTDYLHQISSPAIQQQYGVNELYQQPNASAPVKSEKLIDPFFNLPIEQQRPHLLLSNLSEKDEQERDNYYDEDDENSMNEEEEDEEEDDYYDDEEESCLEQRNAHQQHWNQKHYHRNDECNDDEDDFGHENPSFDDHFF